MTSENEDREVEIYITTEDYKLFNLSVLKRTQPQDQAQGNFVKKRQ